MPAGNAGLRACCPPGGGEGRVRVRMQALGFPPPYPVLAAVQECQQEPRQQHVGELVRLGGCRLVLALGDNEIH